MSVISKRGPETLKIFISENFKIHQSRETRTVSPHSSWPHHRLSARGPPCRLYPRFPLSDRSVCRSVCPVLPLTCPRRLGSGSGTFRNLSGPCQECAGHGSGVGVDLALGSPFPGDGSLSARRLAFLPLSGVQLECRLPSKLWLFHNQGFESFKWLLVRCYTDSFNLPK